MKILIQNNNIFRIKGSTLISLLIIFALTACGTVNVAYDSTIRSPDDFSISLEIKATDLFAEAFRDDPSTFEPQGGNFEMEIIEDTADSYSIRLSLDVKGDEAQRFLAESGDILKIDETILANVIQYRIEVPIVKSFADEVVGGLPSDTPDSDLFGNSFDQGMMEMMDHMITMDISIQVFGDVIDSNADRVILPSENESEMHQLRWHYSLLDLKDAQENPFAITTVEIKKGIFGSCNIFSPATSVEPTPNIDASGYKPIPRWP